MINKKDILPTGVPATLTVRANGYDVGTIEDKKLKDHYKFLPLIKKNLRNIRKPVDLAFKLNNKRRDIIVENLPVEGEALDIGKKTITSYEKEILKAKKVFWKGTAGNCSYKDFCLGTKKLMKAMEKSKAFCIVSGGHSETQLEKYKINKKKLGYVSLSGGAVIHYLSG